MYFGLSQHFVSFLPQVRVVEAFVNSGGNAVLRTADGNIISSGIGAGLGGYSSTSMGVMGTNIVVGSRGQVSTYSSFLKTSNLRVRGVASGAFSSAGGGVYIGRSERYVNVRVIQKSMQTSSKYVVISSAGGGTVVGASGGGGASGGAGGGGESGGAGVGGASGGASGGPVSGGGGAGGASDGGLLDSAASRNQYGEVTAYGSGISSWTIGGATTDGPSEIEVIGDFGGELRYCFAEPLSVLLFVIPNLFPAR